jgi:NAD+ diphosphatase
MTEPTAPPPDHADAAGFVPGLQPPPGQAAADAIGLLVDDLAVLVEVAGDGVRLPARGALSALAAAPWIYLGTLDGRPCFAAPLAAGATPPPGLRLWPARQLLDRLDGQQLAAVGQALALVEWETMHRYCGRCAAETRLLDGERTRRCPRCGARFHPRIAPAVIVLVERGDQILLARNARFPPGWYSAVAGFTEPGESLEETARREVREEVGVEIDDLRYFASQPWPFGRSLMIGFLARYAGGAIHVDGLEIVDAAWFAADGLPALPPKVSIARRLIDAYLASRLSPPC